MSVVRWEGEFQTKQNWMTVRQILSPVKQATIWACQGEKQTAQRREGLPARVWRVKRQTRNNYGKERKVFLCMTEKQSFMRVDEVAQELGVSKSYAYKIVQKLNEELKNKGFLTISGRVNKQYFMERTCYGAVQKKR